MIVFLIFFQSLHGFNYLLSYFIFFSASINTIISRNLDDFSKSEQFDEFLFKFYGIFYGTPTKINQVYFRYNIHKNHNVLKTTSFWLNKSINKQEVKHTLMRRLVLNFERVFVPQIISDVSLCADAGTVIIINNIKLVPVLSLDHNK